MEKTDHQIIEKLQTRIEYLEDSRRFVQNVLEMVLSLSDFQESILNSHDSVNLLEELEKRIRYLIPTEAIAIYNVIQDTADFQLALCSDKDLEPTIVEEVEYMIEQGFFAWAIRERRGVIITSKDHSKHYVLHVIATHSRIRGMLVGMLTGDRQGIPDTSLTLLSIILQNTANALESMEFYRLLRDQNHLLEEKIRDRTRALAEYERQLQLLMKMQAIGTLAGGIAHDFNNILFPIVGFTELTMDDVAPDSQARKNLDEILKATNRAKELVQQILAFSRQSHHERKPLKVHYIVKEALKLLRASIPTSIEIESNLDETCGLIKGDPTQIHQVVMNLCTNAYHAMAEKGGVLKIDMRQIEVGFDDMMENIGMKYGPHVRLTVSDEGMGMEPSVLERIFEPYFTTKEPGKGTGLGLSVIHGIVKNHGGHIRVKSEAGSGTTFDVYLPVIEGTEIEDETNIEIKDSHGNEHIMVVDDEETIVSMERKILERLGYQVTSSTDSTRALREFADQPDKYDLVITDMTMPHMTGDEMAKKMMDIKPTLPVILCTGFNERISEEKALEMGITKFVMKPVITDELTSAIRTVLDNHRLDGGCVRPECQIAS
jgi:signal transduction histidine kinase/CheY-like chemotaxis protein